MYSGRFSQKLALICTHRYFPIGDVNVVTPMEQQPIYTEDWIGLQELNNQNKLVFLVSCRC